MRGTFACPWNIAVRTRGVFTHRAGFQKLACAKRGLVRTGQHLGARDSTWVAGPGAHGESTIFRQARSQPHHQHQKPRANQTSSPGNITHQPASTTSPAPETTRQSSQQPRQHHTSTRSNSITTARSHTPTHITNARNHAPPAQRFLYCDGETPNISLKYFAKYFCVPKPTASETSTTLSPASADNSWAALLSRMVRMNTEGFIP